MEHGESCWVPFNEGTASALIKYEIKGVEDDIRDGERPFNGSVCWPSAKGSYLLNSFLVSAHSIDRNAMTTTPIYRETDTV